MGKRILEKVKLICPNIILNYSMYSFEIPPQALFTLMIFMGSPYI